MRICRNEVRIIEMSQGWTIQWSGRAAEEIATAAEALDAVQSRDRVLADAGISCFTSIVWSPATRIGRMVVSALQV